MGRDKGEKGEAFSGTTIKDMWTKPSWGGIRGGWWGWLGWGGVVGGQYRQCTWPTIKIKNKNKIKRDFPYFRIGKFTSVRVGISSNFTL